jgi:AcrR family transcriptional regulator
MERIMADVKKRRRYDASGRREQARRTRETILKAAEHRFLDDGYAATTMATIAGDAGVSVETIYKAFGGKSGLVRSLYEQGLAGRGPVPAYQRSDQMREAAPDPVTVMREWGQLTAEVALTVTPIRLLMRSAAETDPEIAALLAASDEERLARMRHHASFLEARGYLRDDVNVDHATDILWTCSSMEFYELLVIKRRWSPERFATFITEYMITTLLATDHA